MSEFEIRMMTDDGPSYVSIYYKGVNVTADQLIPAFSGDAERMLPVLQRVAHLVQLKDLFRPGDRCRLKDVNLISPVDGNVWVPMGTTGTVMRAVWTANKDDCVLNVEVDFDSGKNKRMNIPYVHSLSSNHLERIS